MNSSGADKRATESGVESPPAVPRPRALQRLWRAETVFVVALGAFALLAILASLRPYFEWDLAISSRFNWRSFSPPGLLPAMGFLSTFGNGWIPYALTAVTALAFLVVRRRSEAAGLVFSAGGSGLINTLFKLLIARPRPAPDLVPSYRDMITQSFPSGHVTFYVCYFGFLFFVAYALLPKHSTIRRVTLILLALPVLLIGFSRVYLGAHWPSDTVGAYLWSSVWLAISLRVYRRWKARRTFHRV